MKIKHVPVRRIPVSYHSLTSFIMWWGRYVLLRLLGDCVVQKIQKRRVSGTWEAVRILLPPSVLSFHQTIQESPTIIIVKFAIRFGLCARSSAEGEFGKRAVDMIGQMCGCGKSKLLVGSSAWELRDVRAVEAF
jgi:hypothetical protein